MQRANQGKALAGGQLKARHDLVGFGGVWWGGVRCKGAPASSYVGLACWRLVGCRWSAMVGPFLAPGYALRCGVGALLPHLGATWAHVGAMLAHLAAMWAHFGAMWAHLGAMLAHLGATLAHLGAMLTHLKPQEPKKGQKRGEHKTP